MKTNEEKAKQWVGIIAVLENSKYLSMSLVFDFTENIALNYNLPHNKVFKLLEQAKKDIDFEASEVCISVVLK